MSSNWTQNIGLSHPGRGLEFRETWRGGVLLVRQKKRNVGRNKSVSFSKKVVVWFEKLGQIFVAEDRKRWPLTNPKAANLLQHEAGEDDVDLYGGIAALRLANDQLFVSAATQRSPNFSNQTTTFLEKKTDLHVPIGAGGTFPPNRWCQFS